MFWTRWVRGFCAALVISVVAAAVYYGKDIMDSVGGNDGYFKGMSVIAVAVIGSLTVVSLILMISEIAISLNNVNKKLDKLIEEKEEKQNIPQQPYQYAPPMIYPQPVVYQQPAPTVQQYAAPAPQYPAVQSGEFQPVAMKGSWHCACGQKNTAKARFCGKCGLPRNIQNIT